MIRQILFASLVLFFTSCDGSDTTMNTRLIGAWTVAGYEDDVTVMHRTAGLAHDEYGFIFSKSGRFTERKINGWCGTPPVVFEDYDGRWENVTDSQVHVVVGYWGGQTDYTMDVVSVTAHELRFRIIP